MMARECEEMVVEIVVGMVCGKLCAEKGRPFIAVYRHKDSWQLAVIGDWLLLR